MKLPENHRIATFLYYGMRALVILAIALFLWNRDWIDAVIATLILGLMFAPVALKKRYKLYLPFELEVAVVGFIFFTLFLGSFRDFYELFWWWDTLLHFQSGFLLGIIGFVLIYMLNQSQPGKLTLNPFFIAFFSVCFSMAASVVWEIYEFTADKLFGFNMQRDGLQDTMKDLILNTLGALIVATLAYGWMRARLRIPFTPRRLAGTPYDPTVSANPDNAVNPGTARSLTISRPSLVFVGVLVLLALFVALWMRPPVWVDELTDDLSDMIVPNATD